MLSFLKKIKGGGGKALMSKKSDFFGLAKISGRKNGREPKKSAEAKFWPSLMTTLNDFHFGQETKKLWPFKVGTGQKSEKRPYPTPLKVNRTLFTPFPGMKDG
jgi:hypothetical protein